MKAVRHKKSSIICFVSSCSRRLPLSDWNPCWSGISMTWYVHLFWRNCNSVLSYKIICSHVKRYPIYYFLVFWLQGLHYKKYDFSQLNQKGVLNNGILNHYVIDHGQIWQFMIILLWSTQTGNCKNNNYSKKMSVNNN